MLTQDGTAKAYLFAHYADDDIVARRGEKTWSMGQFRRDVTALAQCLPERSHVINVCSDRYRFFVSFAAALTRRQISVMPASIAPATLRALSHAYKDMYAITDRGDLPIPHVTYPTRLDASGPLLDLHIPGQQIASIQFTSGSTGDPKPVPKTWSTLVHSARAAGRRLAISSLRGGSIVSTVPHQHSYGLESNILLALQHGLAVAADSPLYPADVRATLASTPRPRILVTTPIHLRALVAERDGMPEVDLVLSATAALPTSLAIAAESCFQAPLLEIYGCTEAGQIAARRTAQEIDWRLFDGITVFQNNAGNWAKGPAVEGIAPLQDAIDFTTTPQHFRLGVRAQDMVNVAGKRSSLPYLNAQLLSIPGVQDGVFLIDEVTTGMVQRLMAVVVAPTLTIEALRQGLRERLDPAFIPRKLALVDRLPRNATGKLVRHDLLALLGRPS